MTEIDEKAPAIAVLFVLERTLLGFHDPPPQEPKNDSLCHV